MIESSAAQSFSFLLIIERYFVIFSKQMIVDDFMGFRGPTVINVYRGEQIRSKDLWHS